MILQSTFRNLPFAMLIFFAAGCSYVSLPSLPWQSSEVQPDPTAEALFKEGMAYMEAKKYGRAIDRFQSVRDEFPFAPEATEADLKTAEAYYLNKQYPEATLAFNEFLTLRPANENNHFVIYHLGLVHFEQFTTIDRDQKSVETAKGYFKTLIKDHPSSPYAGKAREKLAKCREYLAEHEFYIASFYLREKKYPAARDRFEAILRDYRDTPTGIKALYHLGESYRLEKNVVKAALAYKALIQYYPNSQFAKDARTQLSQLDKEKQDPLAMLLMRDGRPAFVPPPESLQRSAAGGQQKKEKDIVLVAKKEYVYEEPGTQKGLFRRMVDTVNPFASSNNNEDKGNGKEKMEDGKGESKGVLSSVWTAINPFAGEEEAKNLPREERGVVADVDKSLKQQGIDAQAKNRPSPPTPDLPKIAAEPEPSNTAEVLGKIDQRLKKEGRNVTALPPTPQPAAELFVARPSRSKKTQLQTRKRGETGSASTSGLLSSIDKGLKKKGIEPAEVQLTPTDEPKGPEKRQEKVELTPRLPVQKKPYLLDPGEYHVKEAEEGSEEKKTDQTPARATAPPKGLPKAVVQGPPQLVKETPAEKKPALKKNLDELEEEESKGLFDQLREDMEAVGNLLNPLRW